MKLSVKLSLMAGFLMALTIALGLFSLVQMSKINDGTTDINQNWLPSTRYVLNLNVNTSDFRLAQVQLANSPEAQDRARYQARMEATLKDIEKNKSQYAPLIASAQERKAYEGFLRGMAELHGYFKRCGHACQQGAAGRSARPHPWQHPGYF